MTRFLTVEQVLFLHARVLQETGGKKGVRNLNQLRRCISLPAMESNGEEKYSGLLQKAAILFAEIVKARIFEDANKRTAITAAGIFLRINGYRLTASKNEIIRFINVSKNLKTSHEHAVAWFWQYTQPVAANQ